MNVRLNDVSVWLTATTLAMPIPTLAQGFPEYKANNEWNPVDIEVLNLPPYCQATFRPKQFPPVNPAIWRGCPININHFCPGLVALNRSMNPLGTMQQRSYILGIAEIAIRGVREAATPQCPLYNEILGAEKRVQIMRLTVK